MNQLSLVPIIFAALVGASCVGGIVLCVLAGLMKPSLREINGEEEGVE